MGERWQKIQIGIIIIILSIGTYFKRATQLVTELISIAALKRQNVNDTNVDTKNAFIHSCHGIKVLLVQTYFCLYALKHL